MEDHFLLHLNCNFALKIRPLKNFIFEFFLKYQLSVIIFKVKIYIFKIKNKYLNSINDMHILSIFRRKKNT